MRSRRSSLLILYPMKAEVDNTITAKILSIIIYILVIIFNSKLIIILNVYHAMAYILGYILDLIFVFPLLDRAFPVLL
jgi:hypothetical protein